MQQRRWIRLTFFSFGECPDRINILEFYKDEISTFFFKCPLTIDQIYMKFISIGLYLFDIIYIII